MAQLVNLATLVSVSAPGNGPAVSIDQYGLASGAIYGGVYVATSAFTGTSYTPALQMSGDGGNTWVAVPTSVIAAFTAISAVGQVFNPFLIPMEFGLVRIAYTGTFTVVSAVINAIVP